MLATILTRIEGAQTLQQEFADGKIKPIKEHSSRGAFINCCIIILKCSDWFPLKYSFMSDFLELKIKEYLFSSNVHSM